MISTAAAFDPLAPSYDGSFGANPVARRFRERVGREVAARARPGSALVDLGCGTGIDALELARKGHRVLAVDGSPAMLREVDEKARRADLKARIACLRLDLNVPDERRALVERARAEGVETVLSNFGALNCVQDLSSLGRDLGAMLPPGGFLIAAVMGKLQPIEILYHLAKGRIGRAFARLAPGPVSVPLGDRRISIRYYHPGVFCRTLRPWFRTRRREALGVFLPPPYLGRRADRLAGLDALERRLGRVWPLRALGDHLLATLERR